MTDSPYIIHATANNFADVLALSQQKPVLVDFWAPWCAPCRSLKPILEKLAVEYAGGFVLALVNSDEEQALAQQYGVRSLPTLMLFKQGASVQTLMGAQPEPALRALLDPHIAPRASESLRAQAKQALANGQDEQAIQLLSQAAAEDPENYRIHLDLVGVYITQGNYDAANTLFQALGNDAKESKEGKPIAQLMRFTSIVSDAPPPSALASNLQANRQDLTSLYQLAAYTVLDRHFADAIDMYLQIFQQDAQFGEGAAKQCLIMLFDMLNTSQPDLVRQGRRRLQMLMF